MKLEGRLWLSVAKDEFYTFRSCKSYSSYHIIVPFESWRSDENMSKWNYVHSNSLFDAEHIVTPRTNEVRSLIQYFGWITPTYSHGWPLKTKESETPKEKSMTLDLIFRSYLLMVINTRSPITHGTMAPCIVYIGAIYLYKQTNSFVWIMCAMCKLMRPNV